MSNQPEGGRAESLKIGEKLREAREKKALTIDQVQKQTHIHSTVISALEEGRADEILAPNYVQSFLKKYANFLGLDSKSLVGLYVSSHPELCKMSSQLSRLETKSAAPANNIFPVVRRILISILIITIAFFAAKKITNIFKSKKSAKGAVTAAAAKTGGKKTGSAKRNDAFKEIPRSTALSLIIKVDRPVMVQVKKDGVVLFKRVLKKGSVESLTAKNSINIFVAKAESIELTLNGRKLGSPGRGTIEDLEITRSGLRVK